MPDRTIPATIDRAALPPAEGVLLWAMRAWVLARCRTEDLEVETRIETALSALDAAEAGCGLCRFMDAVEQGGSRPVMVERICARQLTPDECTLLDVFSCVQTGRIADAVFALRQMMTTPLLRCALDSACNVTCALAAAGHHLAVLAHKPSPGNPRASAETRH